jgi:hypothetical protein
MQLTAARSSASHPVRAARPCLRWRTNRPGITQTPVKHIPRRGVRSDVSALESFTGFSGLLRPELAAIFSAVIAVGSVGLNLYGGLLTESKRVDLQRQVGPSCDDLAPAWHRHANKVPQPPTVNVYETSLAFAVITVRASLSLQCIE